MAQSHYLFLVAVWIYQDAHRFSTTIKQTYLCSAPWQQMNQIKTECIELYKKSYDEQSCNNISLFTAKNSYFCDSRPGIDSSHCAISSRVKFLSKIFQVRWFWKVLTQVAAWWQLWWWINFSSFKSENHSLFWTWKDLSIDMWLDYFSENLPPVISECVIGEHTTWWFGNMNVVKEGYNSKKSIQWKVHQKLKKFTPEDDANCKTERSRFWV